MQQEIIRNSTFVYKAILLLGSETEQLINDQMFKAYGKKFQEVINSLSNHEVEFENNSTAIWDPSLILAAIKHPDHWKKVFQAKYSNDFRNSAFAATKIRNQAMHPVRKDDWSNDATLNRMFEIEKFLKHFSKANGSSYDRTHFSKVKKQLVNEMAEIADGQNKGKKQAPQNSTEPPVYYNGGDHVPTEAELDEFMQTYAKKQIEYQQRQKEVRKKWEAEKKRKLEEERKKKQDAERLLRTEERKKRQIEVDQIKALKAKEQKIQSQKRRDLQEKDENRAIDRPADTKHARARPQKSKTKSMNIAEPLIGIMVLLTLSYGIFWLGKSNNWGLESKPNTYTISTNNGSPKAKQNASTKVVGNVVIKNHVDNKKTLIKDIQSELKRLGIYSGSIDGQWGSKSRDSLITFNGNFDQYSFVNPTNEVLKALKRAKKTEIDSNIRVTSDLKFDFSFFLTKETPGLTREILVAFTLIRSDPQPEWRYLTCDYILKNNTTVVSRVKQHRALLNPTLINGAGFIQFHVPVPTINFRKVAMSNCSLSTK